MKKVTLTTPFKNPFKSLEYRLMPDTEISPKLAQNLLDGHNDPKTQVRDYTWGSVETISQSIKSGHWRSQTGMLIIFEKETGNILDGQTRLMAIAKSGITVHTGVAVGVSRSPYAGDGGRGRTIGQKMAASQGLGKDDAKAKTRILRIARMWMRNDSIENRRLRWDEETIENFYQERKTYIDAVLPTGLNSKARGSGIRAACAKYFFVSKAYSDAKKFFDLLTGDGGDMTSGSPVLQLYNHLNARSFKGNDRANDDDFLVAWQLIQQNMKQK